MRESVGLELLHAGILDADLLTEQPDFLVQAVPLSSPPELAVHALRSPTLGQRQGGSGEGDDPDYRRVHAAGAPLG